MLQIKNDYGANSWEFCQVTQFKARAKCIETLFSSFSEYGHHVNGKLTLGEVKCV